MLMTLPPLEGEIIRPSDMIRVIVRPSPLRDIRHELDVPAGLTLSAIIDHAASVLDMKAGAWRVSISGDVIPRENWHRIRIKPGVTVMLLRVPQGDAFKQIAAIAVAILATVVAPLIAAPILSALGLTGAAALAVTGVITAGLTIVGSMAINALFPKSSSSSQVDETTRPVFSIGGSQNSASPFGTVPVILGRHRTSPLYAAQPYTEIVGDDQYLRLLFVVGYGPIAVSDIKIGETPLTEFEGVAYEVIENHLVTAPTLFTAPTYEEQLSISLSGPSGTWSSRTTADSVDEFSVDVIFPSGIYRYQKSDGAKVNYTVDVAIQYRLKGASTWIAASGISITSSSAQAIRRSVLVQGLTRGQYDVRVSKTSADYSGVDTVSEQTVWTAIRGRRHATIINFPMPLTLIGMRIKATNELSGTINTLNCIAASKIKSWNGSSWVDDQETSNPADHFRHVLQGSANARPLDDAQIDLDNIQSWRTYCATKGYTFNHVRDQAQSVYDTLRDVAAAGRAALTMRDGKWGVIWDEATSQVVQHFTPSNSSGFQSVRGYADLPHAFRVSFINAANAYKNDERIVYDDGYTSANATKFEGLDFTGVTDADLIWKHARYHIAQLRLQREAYTLTTDFEHLVCMRGDRVRVNHDAVLWGLGSARVKSVATSPDRVILNDTMTMEAGKTYSMRFRLSDGSAIVRTITGVAGSFTEFTLVGTGDMPVAGDLAMFGENTLETVVLRIKSITPGSDLTARLELVDDAPGILTADTGTIPPFSTGIAPSVDWRATAPRQLTYIEEVETTIPALSRTRVSWLPPIDGTVAQYVIRYRSSGNDRWAETLNSANPSITLNSLTPGLYDIQVQAIFTNEQTSGPLSATLQMSIFAGTPDDVTGFQITVSGDIASLKWDANGSAIVAKYQIRFSSLTSGATWATAAILQDNVTGLSVQVPAIKGTYLIKAVSYANVMSNGAALIINAVDPLNAFNAVQDIVEGPAFGGTFDQTNKTGSTLRLSLQGDVFALSDFFEPADFFLSGGGYEALGYYYFTDVFDLGSVYTSRLSASIAASGEQSSSDMFGLADFFSPADFFGYAATSLWDVTIEVDTTNDDPGGSPTWSGWSDLVIGDVSARAYRFRARLETRQADVTPVVSDLRVSVDMPDRTVKENDLVVTTAGRTITYSPSFRASPGVSVSVQGLQTGDYYEITGKTNAGFTIIFKNASGVAIARTFDYVAKGYGYQQ
jgi:hypothetical protein